MRIILRFLLSPLLVCLSTEITKDVRVLWGFEAYFMKLQRSLSRFLLLAYLILKSLKSLVSGGHKSVYLQDIEGVQRHPVYQKLTRKSISLLSVRD